MVSIFDVRLSLESVVAAMATEELEIVESVLGVTEDKVRTGVDSTEVRLILGHLRNMF